MGWTFYMIISTQWLSSGIPSQLTNIAQITAAVAISIGGLGVLFGIAGFCTLKFRHALLVASYGILGFLLTAIYALAAIVLVYLYVVKTDQVDLFCKGNLKAGIGKLQPYVNNLYNQTKVWDSTFNSSVSSFMCKSTCPCVPVNQSLWNATTKQQFSLPKATGGVYNFTGNYTKFSDCYSDQKKVIDGGSNKTALISLTRLSQISFFEQQLDCSGMC